MRRLVDEMLDQADTHGTTPRVAAQVVVDRNLAAIEERFPSVGH